MKSLSKNDVSVHRLFNATGTVYKYPMVINKVELASDGLSATVEFFSELADKTDYLVSVNGFEDYTMTASKGSPASMTISAKNDSIYPFITAGVETQLVYRLYDANGVDVTTGNESVLFNVKDYATDGSYYVAGDKIWFLKSGLTATVVAEYQSGRFENGLQVGNITTSFAFQSVDASPVVFQGIVDATVNGWDSNKTMNIPMGSTNAKLEVKIKLSNSSDPVTITSNQQDVGIGKITFESVNQDYVILNRNTMNLILCRKGQATIIVNLETTDALGNITKTPVGAVTVNVTDARALNTVTPSKSVVTVGSTVGFCTETVKLTAKDQYGQDVVITSVVPTLLTNVPNAGAIANGVTVNANNELVFDGSVLANAITTGTAMQLSYKVKVNYDKEITINVLVKKDTGITASNYIAVESTAFGDIARTLSSKDAKTVTFSAYVMNNGIKVAELQVAPYPASASEEHEGKYFYRVEKNGADITAQTTATTNGATIAFSGLEEISDGAVTGSAVKYDLGAGNYSFHLYKCIKSGSNYVFVKQQTVTGQATCNTGSYTYAGRVAESTASLSQADLRACFSIKDTKGNEATSAYYVDVDQASTDAGSPYVYVRSITFYDDLGNNEYAKYTVNVGVSLRK